MANPDHLQILDHGVETWNRWRHEWRTGCLKPDLRSVSLRSRDLSHFDFVDSDLDRADLAGSMLDDVDFSRANLRGVDFGGASAVNSSFHGAYLAGADFSRAILSNADLFRADLRRAKFCETVLTRTNFSEVKLFRTIFAETGLSFAESLESCRHIGPSNIDWATLMMSPQVPASFLRGCGLPEQLINYRPSRFEPSIHFYSCFISYSHADTVFALKLHDRMQERGVRCWLDQKHILPGDDIYEAVDRGIRLWDKVLLCCSVNSLKSWWVDDEIEKAFAKERALMTERGTKVWSLIPLDLDGYLLNGWTSGKASQVRSRLAADFKDWETSEAKFDIEAEKVIRSLRADAFGREQPPAPRL